VTVQPTPTTSTTSTAAPASTQEATVSRVKKAVPVYPPFSPYNLFYYCSRCGRWILQHSAPRDGKGRPYCPYCGPGAYLRLSPRSKRWEP
jgi:DNA-directed RNA polymerase subunit RPC12/RpoP